MKIDPYSVGFPKVWKEEMSFQMDYKKYIRFLALNQVKLDANPQVEMLAR